MPDLRTVPTDGEVQMRMSVGDVGGGNGGPRHQLARLGCLGEDGAVPAAPPVGGASDGKPPLDVFDGSGTPRVAG